MERTMKRFLAVVSILLMLTACGANNQPVEDMTANNAQTGVENNSGEIPQVPVEEETEASIREFELNETFQTLLDEVNAAHSAVEMYDGDYSAYLGRIEDAEYEAYNANLTEKNV